MQSQLFSIDSYAHTNRSADRDTQARESLLEAQLVKTQRDLAAMKTARNNLKAVNSRLEKSIEAQKLRIDELLAMVSSLQTTRASTVCQMPMEVWRRLMQLCHPDKHGGSAAANNATQWLNRNKPPL